MARLTPEGKAKKIKIATADLAAAESRLARHNELAAKAGNEVLELRAELEFWQNAPVRDAKIGPAIAAEPSVELPKTPETVSAESVTFEAPVQIAPVAADGDVKAQPAKARASRGTKLS